MGKTTGISWADSTINFFSGCTRVSEGCRFCYAEALAKRFPETYGQWGKGKPRVWHKGAVKSALAMNRKPWICDTCGEAYKNQPFACCGTAEFHRRRIFVNSLSDWLDAEVPIEWLAELLDTIRRCGKVTWILCSKRPENFFKRLIDCIAFLSNNPVDETASALIEWLHYWLDGSFFPLNIIILASVENQATADKRIPELLKIPAACRGLSLEPLLGAVDLSKWSDGGLHTPESQPIGWYIVGGESGSHARPCRVDWIRSLVQQGKAAGVPVFVKQFSGSRPSEQGLLPDDIWNTKEFPTICV